MNKEIWNKWIANIDFILEIAKKRNWDYSKLRIKKPVKLKQVERLENKLGITYPSDFKLILTEYSSGLWLDWQIENDDEKVIYDNVFCGGGRGYLWDFDNLKEDYKGYLDWIKMCFPNKEDEYDKIWHDKIPFLDVPNGDMIAFGEKTEKGHPVIYLSHEEGELHGYRLAENFIDFISRWTNIGCVGTEEWQFEPFYDFDNSILRDSGIEIDNWKKWLKNAL